MWTCSLLVAVALAGSERAGRLERQHIRNLPRVPLWCRHLHQLLELPLEVPRLVTMMMETRPAHDVLDQLTAPNTAPVAGGVPQHMMITGLSAMQQLTQIFVRVRSDEMKLEITILHVDKGHGAAWFPGQMLSYGLVLLKIAAGWTRCS